MLEQRVQETIKSSTKFCRHWRVGRKGNSRELQPECFVYFPFHLAFLSGPGKIPRAAFSRRQVRSLFGRDFQVLVTVFSHVGRGSLEEGSIYSDRHDGRDGRRPRNTLFAPSPRDAVGNLQGWRPTKS